MDKNRTWCPKAGCETICTLQPNKMIMSTIVGGGGGGPLPSSSASVTALNIEKSLPMKLSASSNDMTTAAGTSLIMSQGACAVHCPTCFEDFCSGCKKTVNLDN